MHKYCSWIIVFMITLTMGCADNQSEIFNTTVGCYILDLSRTKLGDYSDDSIKFSNIQLVFRDDSTFQLSKDVPFLVDSVGAWVASEGGIDDWSWLRFSIWEGKPSSKNGNAFSPVFRDGADSVLYFYGAAYKDRFTGIQEIYFKKVDNKVCADL